MENIFERYTPTLDDDSCATSHGPVAHEQMEASGYGRINWLVGLVVGVLIEFLVDIILAGCYITLVFSSPSVMFIIE